VGVEQLRQQQRQFAESLSRMINVTAQAARKYNAEKQCRAKGREAALQSR